MLGGYDPFGWL